MRMISGTAGQPGLDRLGFVGGVIVHGDVDVEVVGRAGVDFLEEGQELLRPLAFVTFADDESTGYVERGEERGRAVDKGRRCRGPCRRTADRSTA